ncbi:MAG: D-alanyl-D-alanine carboxypeptidase, partial [Anaerovoracaceae bacterium]
MTNSNQKSVISFLMAFIIAAGIASPAQGFAAPQAVPETSIAQPPSISAQNAIVIEQSTGKVLYEKNSRQKAYPASTTKIVTALLAIESGSLDRVVRVAGAAEGVEGSSIYLATGERMPLRDLV